MDSKQAVNGHRNRCATPTFRARVRDKYGTNASDTAGSGAIANTVGTAMRVRRAVPIRSTDVAPMN